MAIIDATPVTDFQGGLIALGVALALLVLRGWLTRPRRSRPPRLVVAPPPPVRPVRSSDAAHDERNEEEDDGGEVASGLKALLGEKAARRLPARHASPLGARSLYNGRH
jgi:hypothetical protein